MGMTTRGLHQSPEWRAKISAALSGRPKSAETIARLKANGGRKSTPALDRFWSKVDQSGGPDACWPWMGNRHIKGYGRIRVTLERGRYSYVTTSRLALELALARPLGPGELACHRCDNPPCCNPAHLFAGDKRANGQDMSTKGRGRGAPRGELHQKAKLTEDDVRAIRAAFAGGQSKSAIARAHGCHVRNVRAIVNGSTWRHVI